MSQRNVPRRFLPFALALALATLAPAAAQASTAANTVITHTVTVNYNDAGGTAQTAVTASASVTVDLVPAKPLVSSPANVSIAQGGTAASLVYTVTGTANGPDTYSVTSAATPTNVAATTPGLPANFTLGGSTLAAAAATGATVITVPYDGNVDNDANVVNGLAINDEIVVGGNVYRISGITENAASNTSTIALTPGITGTGVAAGTVVGERATITVTIPPGTVTSGSSGSYSVVTTVASVAAPGQSTPQTTPTVVTVNRPTLIVVKQVSVNDGASWSGTGIAAPGTSLIYKITVTNGGDTDAAAVTIADTLPAYLTYVAGSAKRAASDTTYAAATALPDGTGGYTVAGASLTWVAGTVSTGASNTLVFFYRATIN